MHRGDSQEKPGITARKRRYLQTMGIDVWVERTPANTIATEAALDLPPVKPDTVQPEFPVSGEVATPRPEPVIRTDPSPGWEQLRSAVASCQACPLHETRTQTVFGIGSENADWLFVGEAPGADEDAQGEPFVGRAGKLLNAMLFALGLAREQVFIANVLKCRPPNNRDPRPEEVAACEHFLRDQISLIKPRIIVALGRHAAHNLLKTDQPLSRLRGKIHTYENTPLLVTYHPAYLLRSPAEKAKAWADLCLAQKQVAES
ncbi:MAG: uracil-DNA glycosylase [Acidiferrobacterales bacterium]|nr:uracil-DNA glycosylase [Acidiferrobacterales bacterium]